MVLPPVFAETGVSTMLQPAPGSCETIRGHEVQDVKGVNVGDGCIEEWLSTDRSKSQGNVAGNAKAVAVGFAVH